MKKGFNKDKHKIGDRYSRKWKIIDFERDGNDNIIRVRVQHLVNGTREWRMVITDGVNDYIGNAINSITWSDSVVSNLRFTMSSQPSSIVTENVESF